MPRRPDVFLETALLALRRVSNFLGKRSLSDYLADELCQSAVERQLEIAGDALGQLRKLDAALYLSDRVLRSMKSNAIGIIALSQSNPLKAIAELVENPSQCRGGDNRQGIRGYSPEEVPADLRIFLH